VLGRVVVGLRQHIVFIDDLDDHLGILSARIAFQNPMHRNRRPAPGRSSCCGGNHTASQPTLGGFPITVGDRDEF
jgi:hypothetical protein